MRFGDSTLMVRVFVAFRYPTIPHASGPTTRVRLPSLMDVLVSSKHASLTRKHLPSQLIIPLWLPPRIAVPRFACDDTTARLPSIVRSS
jgi:hypothetical protein